jgi:hypothetical protein
MSMNGLSTELRFVLERRANTCSTEGEYGLTPLHYAVWNGYVECVKLLIANDMGVDNQGIKRSSINMVSCLGLTALHLVALDTPKKVVKEITMLLLLAGSDRSIQCKKGRTPLDIARDEENMDLIETCKAFDQAEEFIPTEASRPFVPAFTGDEAPVKSPEEQEQERIEFKIVQLQEQYAQIRKSLKENYCYQLEPHARVSVDEMAGICGPEFSRITNAEERIARLPPGMTVHEQHISPITKFAFNQLEGVPAMKCLGFSRDQALINRERRARLIKESNPDWQPSEKIENALKMNHYN